MKQILAVFMVFLFAAGDASAETTGGRWSKAGSWYDGCKEKVNEQMCAAYIRGLHDGIRVQAVTFKVKPSYCVPSSVTAGEMLKSFLAFIPKHIEMLESPTATVFITHMHRLYPCNP